MTPGCRGTRRGRGTPRRCRALVPGDRLNLGPRPYERGGATPGRPGSTRTAAGQLLRAHGDLAARDSAGMIWVPRREAAPDLRESAADGALPERSEPELRTGKDAPPRVHFGAVRSEGLPAVPVQGPLSAAAPFGSAQCHGPSGGTPTPGARLLRKLPVDPCPGRSGLRVVEVSPLRPFRRRESRPRSVTLSRNFLATFVGPAWGAHGLPGGPYVTFWVWRSIVKNVAVAYTHLLSSME